MHRTNLKTFVKYVSEIRTTGRGKTRIKYLQEEYYEKCYYTNRGVWSNLRGLEL